MDAQSALPNITKTQFSPQIKDNGIILEYSESESDNDKRVIQGGFSLSKNENASVYGPPHKAIVVVINFDGQYTVVKPCSALVAFVDEIEETKSSRIGYFQFNMFDYFEPMHEGAYYIVASIGKYLSNILTIPIR